MFHSSYFGQSFTSNTCLFSWRMMGDLITPVISVVNSILIPFNNGFYILQHFIGLLEKYLKLKPCLRCHC